jgi:nucleoside-diphosphate-sugar epimerase
MPLRHEMRKIFLTGSTGFVGSRLLNRLQNAEVKLVVAELDRTAGADLLEISSYDREIADADTVVHLAAATGKASPSAHNRVNAEGTRILIEHSRRCGVRRFIFASSIAVKFPDIRRYPYARAKLAAEAAVSCSGLDYTIVRPTMIFGKGSPIMESFCRLAVLPVVPIFGTGLTRVQPIYVDDLIECLISLVVQDGLASCETIDLGGPEVIPIELLLVKIRKELTGGRMKALHVPLAPVQAAMGALETFARSILPVTSGQLSTFRFDGVAEPNVVSEQHRARMSDVSHMLKRSLFPESIG